MQTSSQAHFSIRLFYVSLLTITGVAVWFSQNSINAYWQQTYHQDSPLTQLNRFSWWAKGADLQQKALDFYQAEKNTLENITLFEEKTAQVTSENMQKAPETAPLELPVLVENTGENADLGNSQPENTARATQTELPVEQHAAQEREADTMLQEENIKAQEDEVEHSATSYAQQTSSENIAENALTEDNNINNDIAENSNAQTPQVTLTTKDKVLFAGDSLMQGVAPHIQKWLKSNYKIQSINLSKQSTGLSYPSFFDWPKTIEDTLKQNPDIRLIVIFLGPNDPWDFPDPNKKYKYLKFQSEEWESIYKQRIERILDSAKRYHAEVIWLGIPHMKKGKLNSQMAYLNQILTEIILPPAILLPTEKLLSEGKDDYVDSITYKGKQSRVRSKDGIHFSPDGQRIIADYVQQHISIQ